MAIDVEAVRKAAGSVRDPEIRRPIAEMGLLDDVQVEEDCVTVYYHLTSPLCPTKFATQIGRDIRKRVEGVPGVASCTVVLRDHYQREHIHSLVNPHIPLRQVP